MATIANWNGHTFVVSSRLVRSFTDLKIKGSSETTEKNSDKHNYEEHKNGEAYEISMTVCLSAQMGVTNVYSEAMAFVHEAAEGATAYFYIGGSKLLPAEMMLTSAEVEEIEYMPGKGNRWVSAQVKLTFKQGTENDEKGGRASVTTNPGPSSPTNTDLRPNITEIIEKRPKRGEQDIKNNVTQEINKVNDVIEKAHEASEPKDNPGGLEYQQDLIDKVTTTKPDTSEPVSPTTTKPPKTNVNVEMVK